MPDGGVWEFCDVTVKRQKYAILARGGIVKGYNSEGGTLDNSALISSLPANDEHTSSEDR